MLRKNRKLRLGLVIGLAVVAFYYAWQTSQAEKPEPCVPGRHEVKDDNGNVVAINRISCAEQKK